MHLPVTPSTPPHAPEPPALVRVVAREDVLWNRPIFKAPPLHLHPKLFDVSAFVADLPKVGFGSR